MVSSTVGSPTITGWKRRSSAASFSMCLRYSSSVVAPIVCSSPRASIGFSMFEASIEPSDAPGADHGVELVDEEHDLAFGVDDLLEHGLQPILELAAVLRAGNQRAHVEGDDALVLEPFGHVAADDALRQAFDDGGLADAGFADQHRVVLGAARQHLDDAADFLVAADHRIELALAGQLGEVAAVLLERLVLVLGIRIGHALVAANAGQRFEHAARASRCAASAGRSRRRAPGSPRMPSSRCSVLTILVLHRLGLGLRGVEDDAQARGEVRLRAAVRLRLLARDARAAPGRAPRDRR